MIAYPSTDDTSADRDDRNYGATGEGGGAGSSNFNADIVTESATSGVSPAGRPFNFMMYTTDIRYWSRVRVPGPSSGIVVRICSYNSNSERPTHFVLKSALVTSFDSWQAEQVAVHTFAPSAAWASVYSFALSTTNIAARSDGTTSGRWADMRLPPNTLAATTAARSALGR